MSFSRAGSALLWQATQHFGVKAIFLVRLLILARLAGLTAIILTGLLLWVLERRFALGISESLVRAFPRATAVVGLSPGQLGPGR